MCFWAHFYPCYIVLDYLGYLFQNNSSSFRYISMPPVANYQIFRSLAFPIIVRTSYEENVRFMWIRVQFWMHSMEGRTQYICCTRLEQFSVATESVQATEPTQREMVRTCAANGTINGATSTAHRHFRHTLRYKWCKVKILFHGFVHNS